MPVIFHTKKITISNAEAFRTVRERSIFRSKVIRAAVAVSGFKLFYHGGDHHVMVVGTSTDKIKIVGNSVFFNVTVHLADQSVNDAFTAQVRILIIAEVEPVVTILQKRTRRSSSPRLKRKSLTGGRSRSHRVTRKRTSR